MLRFGSLHRQAKKQLFVSSVGHFSSKPHDYSKTLLLPKTTFEMRANAYKSEPTLLNRCTTDLYHYQLNTPSKRSKTWIMHDGPPYANGSPHIGHALNKILKDVVTRYKLLRGYKVNFIPGNDNS
jgi:isoleucyl-tRNA synthetase